ncbi:hypothetical protein [Brevundimonas sp. GCM10030266]|uniref:hypothetical protein n=1 Tax=Brevundimonas sp. GCM10030266 TaxID=3273386 RepID=UPI00361F156C
MTKLRLAMLASTGCLFVTAGVADSQVPPVTTAISFGPYVNCIVTNNLPRPIMVTSIQYHFQGAAGPGGYTIPCTSNCVVGARLTKPFSGQVNNGAIASAGCAVSYDLL